MTVLYIVAALVELASLFVNELVTEREKCMGRKVTKAFMAYLFIRTV